MLASPSLSMASARWPLFCLGVVSAFTWTACVSFYEPATACNTDQDCEWDEICQDGTCRYFSGAAELIGTPEEDGGNINAPDDGGISRAADSGTQGDGGEETQIRDGGAIVDSGLPLHDSGMPGFDGGVAIDAGVVSPADAGVPLPQCDAPVPAEGLLLHFDFDEQTPHVVMNQREGTYSDGQVNGAVYTHDGYFCGGLFFPPLGTEVVPGVTFSLMSSSLFVPGLSGALWVRPHLLSEEGEVRLIASENGSGETLLLLSLKTHAVTGAVRPEITLRVHSGLVTVESEGPGIVNDAWVHLAFTYDGLTLKLYQDGIEVGQETQSGAVVLTDDPTILGRPAGADLNTTVQGEVFSGTMDQVLAYGRALLASEVSSLAEPIPVITSFPWAACDIRSFEGHAYALCHEPLSAADARNVCLGYGMDLAMIDNAVENEYLWRWMDEALPASERVTFGMSDRHEEGFFRRLDGNPIAFSGWYKDEPNNFPMWVEGENCTELVRGGFWNDLRCSVEQPFVCESQDDPTDVFRLCRDRPADCPCEILTAEGSDYLRCPNAQWANAAALCRLWGSDLPSFSSEEEMDAFMPVRDVAGGKTWLGAKKVSNVWTWSDGTAWTYDNWQDGEDFSENSEDECAIVRGNGQWEVVPCDGNRVVLCPFPELEACVDTDNDGWGPGCFQQDDCDPSSPSETGLCPPVENLCDGLLLDIGSENDDMEALELRQEFEKAACGCSDIENGDFECTVAVDWYTARDVCTSLGMQLIDINDSLYNNAVATTVQDDVWIGLTSDRAGLCWVGQSCTQSWENVQDESPEEGCVYLQKELGDWHVDACPSKRPFICEIQ